MNHAVVMLMYNQVPAQLELSKEAVESVFAQDIGNIDLYLINNGSTYETRDWLKTLEAPNGHNVYIENFRTNRSPTVVANEIMASLFGRGYQTICGTPNDAILPPNMLRELHRWPRGMVTASQSGDRNFTKFEESHVVNCCTPMAVMLLRKWCHDAIVAKDGYFFCTDLFHYASDNDLALRMSACGIVGCQLDIQYYHACSSSWRMLPPEQGQIITRQADVDRATFERRWNFRVDSAMYGESAGNINFRGEPNG
jgi:GT2 family glycosyltransferase